MKNETMENELASRFTTTQLENELHRRKMKKENKTKSQTLADKEKDIGNIMFIPMFHKEDVKEFIRQLKEELCEEILKYGNSGQLDRIPQKQIIDEIDKLSGFGDE